jgi:tetratricopeptide (TPR) repeat protein
MNAGRKRVFLMQSSRWRYQAASGAAALAFALCIAVANAQWSPVWPPYGKTDPPYLTPFDRAPNPDALSTFSPADAIDHAAKGQFTAALAELDQGIFFDSQNAGLYDVRGTVLLRMGEIARAKADIDHALAIEPTNLDFQAHAANVLDAQGDHARAVAEFDRILGLNPQHVPSHVGKGAALLAMGQFDRALAEFDRALAIKPNPMLVDVLTARGIGLAAKGRLKEANANIERAADSSADNAKVVIGRAMVLLLGKQADRAITVLDRSIAAGNEDFTAYLLRGKALGQTGAFDRAISDLDQALNLQPRSVEALNARANAWMKKKDYTRALADLDQSIEAQPSVVAYVVRAVVYEFQGKCNLAMADYRQARELKPGNQVEIDAQAAAKTRLDQYAHRKACGPVGERKLADSGAATAL